MFTLVVPIQAALPELLSASRDDTAWAVTSTLLVAAVVTPIAGRLGDMYGKRRIVLILVAVMVLGSVMAALSNDLLGLIAGRGLQGAISGVIPLGIAILRDTLHERRVAPSVALISATMGVGGAVGMPLSALLTEQADWHLVFWLAAALGAIVFALILWIVPVSVLRVAGKFDVVGTIGLALGLLGILLMISRGNDWGWASPLTLLSGGLGLIILLVWGWYEWRAENPLIDLRIAGRPAILLTNLASTAAGFALFASNVAYPQLLEMPLGAGGLGLSLLNASFVVMVSGILMMIISPFSGWIANAVGPKLLMVLGSAALVGAYGFTVLFSSAVWHMVLANVLIGVGIGFTFAAMPMLIMRSVPQSETGVSNGLNALFRSIGTASGSAVLGAILAGFTQQYEGTVLPSLEGFQIAFTMGLIAAVISLAIALFIPTRRDPHEARPSLPHPS